MSLIRVRRDRKRSWIDVKKTPPPWKLFALLVLVTLVIWYLGARY